MTQHTKKFFLYLATGGLIMLLIVFGYYACGILLLAADEGISISDVFKYSYSDREPLIPTHQAKFQQIMQKISEAALTDTVLESPSDNTLELLRGKMYGGCIRGSAHWIYGSDADYKEVLKHFDYAFLSVGWKSTSYRDTSYHGFDLVKNEEKDFQGTVTAITTAHVYLTQVEPSSVKKGNFKTYYSVGLIYADPSENDCFG